MKKKEYLKMMEEHSSINTVNLFKKVHITTKRAKALYELDEASKASLSHKPTFQLFLKQMKEKSEWFPKPQMTLSHLLIWTICTHRPKL